MDFNERKPKQYDLTCHVGATLKYYCQRDKQYKWDTNRNFNFVTLVKIKAAATQHSRNCTHRQRLARFLNITAFLCF